MKIEPRSIRVGSGVTVQTRATEWYVKNPICIGWTIKSGIASCTLSRSSVDAAHILVLAPNAASHLRHILPFVLRFDSINRPPEYKRQTRKPEFVYIHQW